MSSTKSHILKILEENRGLPVSGAVIAGSLNISRAAVWKAVEDLRKEGFEIQAVTNKGYSLSSGSDILSAEGIMLDLIKTNVNIKKEDLHIYKSLESTNLTAKKMAVEGAAHGTVILSEEQTKGRGRLGRSFFSPKGTGIYMSIILRPSGTAEKAVPVTTAAAVAVCRAISSVLKVETCIKWVNDIYMSNRKICGILTEAVSDFESGSIESIILGIGINYSTPAAHFPDDIKNIAASLYSEPEMTPGSLKHSADKPSRNKLAAAVIEQVLALTENLDPADFMEEYKSRCFIIGKDITVYRGNEIYNAKAVDINNEGALIVRKTDGSEEILNSGEVSVRSKDIIHKN